MFFANNVFYLGYEIWCDLLSGISYFYYHWSFKCLLLGAKLYQLNFPKSYIITGTVYLESAKPACLTQYWESIWYQQKNYSFFETILRYALTHLFNIAADLLNKMSNWLINSKLVRGYQSHISILLSIKFPYMPQCWNIILKSLRLQMEFCLYSAWGLIKGILKMSVRNN